jgi:hypothetical protein
MNGSPKASAKRGFRSNEPLRLDKAIRLFVKKGPPRLAPVFTSFRFMLIVYGEAVATASV